MVIYVSVIDIAISSHACTIAHHYTWQILDVCCDDFAESSENSVIELIDEFKAVGFEKLRAIAQQSGLFTTTHLETFEDAPNNAKKFEIILAALMNMLKPQLIHFIRSLATQSNLYSYSYIDVNDLTIPMQLPCTITNTGFNYSIYIYRSCMHAIHQS